MGGYLRDIGKVRRYSNLCYGYDILNLFYNYKVACRAMLRTPIFGRISVWEWLLMTLLKSQGFKALQLGQ